MPEIWTAIGVVVTLNIASTIYLTTQIHAHDARFDAHDARFDAINARFDAHDAKFDAINARLDRVIEMIAAQASHQHH